MSIYEYDEERHMRQTREEGWEEGELRERRKIAGNMKRSGRYSAMEIKNITGMDLNEIEKL